MAGLRLHSPVLHPEHYCSQRRVRGQSDWLSFLCKTLSFSVSSRFIPALSPTPNIGQGAVTLTRAKRLPGDSTESVTTTFSKVPSMLVETSVAAPLTAKSAKVLPNCTL